MRPLEDKDFANGKGYEYITYRNIQPAYHSEADIASVVNIHRSHNPGDVRSVVQVVRQVISSLRCVDSEQGQGGIGGRIRDVVDDEEGRGAPQPHSSVLPRDSVVPLLCDVDGQALCRH